MPPKFYKKYEISDSDLHEWSVILHEREEVYNYLVKDLMDIVNTDVPIKSIEVVPLRYLLVLSFILLQMMQGLLFVLFYFFKDKL